MAALRPLPQEVRSRLRASAAIASPAQCVEELVLNSLDATSTCVAVRVNLNAGRIQIVDNGVGISPQQLTSVAERYCTSKCHSMADLDNLCHYGYRGEALASMRDMAFMLEIETRGQHSATTYRRIFQKNQEVETVVSETHRPSAGTTVTVYDLFHALPVRKLRLNPVLELERIRQRVEAIALIHPSVSFSLRNDDTCLKILQTHKANSVLGAFTHLFGSAKSRHLVAAHSECGVYTVEGYLSTEPHHSKNLQFIYINERLVFKSPLHKTVNQLVSSSGIVKRRAGSIGSPATGNNSPSSSSRAYGIFVLNVQCPVTLYDITADPAKTLVEFQDWPAVLACMQQAVSDVLLQESLLVTAQTVSANSSDVPNTKTAGVTGTCISTKQLSHTRHSSMVRRPRGTPIDDGVHPADSSSIEKVEESVTTDVSTEQSVRVSDPPGADLTQAGPAAHFLCNTSVSNGTSDAQTTCLPSVAQSPVHQQPSTELHLNKDNARHHLSNTTTTSTSSGNSSQHDSSSSRPRKTGFTSSSKKTATHLISVNDTAPVVCSLRRLREAYTPETIHKAVSAQRLSVAKALKTQNTKSALQTMTEKQGQTAEKPGKESQKRLAGNPSSNLLQLKACTAQQLDKIMLRKLQTLREKLKSKSTPLTKLSQHQPATGSRENQPQRQNQTSLPLASASERKRPTTCAASTLSNKVAKLAQVAESWTSNSSGKQVDTGQNVTQLSKPDLDVAKAVCHVDSTDRQGSHQGDTGGVRENPSNQSVVPVFESQGFFNNTEEFQPTTACEEFDIKPAVSKVMAVNCKESVHVGSLTEEQSHSCRTNQTETDIADYQQTSKITSSADILDTLKTSTVNSASSQTSIDISDTLQITTPGISLTDNIQASRADMSDNIQTSRADMSDNIQASRADMSDNIQASRADMSDNIQASRADMSDNIQASRADMSGNIQASRADMSDNIQTSRTDMSDNIQTSRADMSDNIQTSRADMSDNIQTSRADMSDNIQTSRADMSDNIQTSRADMSDNIQTSRADMSDNIQTSRADMSDNIQTSRTDMSDNIQTSRADMSDNIQTSRADMSDNIQTSRADMSDNIQTSRADMSDNIQTSRADMSDNIQTSRADMSDNIQTSRADMLDNIQASRADMSDNIQTSRTDMSDNIQTSRADMSDNIQTSRADMSDNIQTSRADMSDNIQTSRADMSDNIQTSRADMSDNIQTSRADMSDNIQTSRADMLDNIQASRADMSDVLHTRAISRAHSLLRPGVASPHNFPKVSLGTSDSLPRSKADGSRSQKTSLTDLDMSHLLAVVSDSWQTCSQQSDVPDKGQMHCLGSDLPDTTNNNQGISGESNTCSIGLLKTAALEPEAFANQSSLILDTDNLCQTKDTPVHPNSAMCGDTATYCHWQTMTDVSGREMFVEPVSGNTSYTAPASATRTFTTVSTSDATIKTVLKPNSLLDHAGCAQLAETQGIDAPTPQPLSPDSQQSLRGLLQAQTQQWQQEHFVKWKQPPDSTTVDVDEDQPTTSFQQYNWKQPPDSSVSQLHKLLLSHKFTANMLKTVQVLGQVDNKFIVCLMSSEDSLHRIGAVADLVVIVDQHAAHERVRLETLIREAYKDPDSAQRSLKAGDITPPMKITLTRDEVRLLQAYKTQVKKIGVQYEVVPSSSESILVHTAPSCLLHREAEEQRRGRNSLTYNTLQAVLKEQINLLLKTGGASQSLPTALHQLLCSQACHGAIKFGDRLSQGQCCELMSALSQCQLPFQCAHGRPAVQPLLSLPQLCRLLPAQMPQHPKLWRLRDM